MKRFVSVILTLAMVFALLPAILVSADDTTATMEMSGVRIEYPTCDKSSNETSKPPQTSTTFSSGKNPDVEITYPNSFERIEWLSTTSPAAVCCCRSVLLGSTERGGIYNSLEFNQR